MTGKEVEALLKAAEGVLKMAEDVGNLLGNLIDKLTPDDEEEVEFSRCVTCGTEGPVVVYKTMDGKLIRRVWCGVCSKR